jgi:hypothetical protein
MDEFLEVFSIPDEAFHPVPGGYKYRDLALQVAEPNNTMSPVGLEDENDHVDKGKQSAVNQQSLMARKS